LPVVSGCYSKNRAIVQIEYGKTGFGQSLDRLEGIILLLKIKVKSAVFRAKHTIS
jgi:hypothetical protein